MPVKNRFITAMAISAVIILLFFSFGYYHLVQEDQRDSLDQRIEIISRFAEATREYVQTVLKPRLDQHVGSFVPECPSSAYVTHSIFGIFNQSSPHTSYRRATLDPLNLDNLATAWERELIQRFRNDASLQTLSGVETKPGESFQYLATPVRTQEQCLSCHGDPQQAPLEIQKHYGTDHGYQWSDHEVVGASILKISLSQAQHVTDRHYLIYGIFVTLFLAMAVAGIYFFQRMVNQRLLALLEVMRTIEENPLAGSRMPEGDEDEFGWIARSFNRTAVALIRSQAELEEKVLERTQELEEKVREKQHFVRAIEDLGRRNRLILDAMGDGVFGVDLKGKTTFVNQSAVSLLGWRPDEMLGKSQHQLSHHTHPDGSPFAPQTCPVFSTIRHGIQQKVDNEWFWRKDGTSFPVEYASTPIMEEGRSRGAVVVFRDISKHKETQRKHARFTMLLQVVNGIYDISFQSQPLEMQLQKALDRVLSIPWLFVQSKGAIFLVDKEEKNLIMVASRGMEENLMEKCAQVPFGFCLCGRAAQEEVLVYASSVDERHEVSSAEMEPHGHLVQPLFLENKRIGVLNLYVQPGYQFNEEDRPLLSGIANSLSHLIHHKRTEARAGELSETLEEKVKERTATLQETIHSLQRAMEERKT